MWSEILYLFLFRPAKSAHLLLTEALYENNCRRARRVSPVSLIMSSRWPKLTCMQFWVIPELSGTHDTSSFDFLTRNLLNWPQSGKESRSDKTEICWKLCKMLHWGLSKERDIIYLYICITIYHLHNHPLLWLVTSSSPELHNTLGCSRIIAKFHRYICRHWSRDESTRDLLPHGNTALIPDMSAFVRNAPEPIAVSF